MFPEKEISSEERSPIWKRCVEKDLEYEGMNVSDFIAQPFLKITFTSIDSVECIPFACVLSPSLGRLEDRKEKRIDQSVQ